MTWPFGRQDCVKRSSKDFGWPEAAPRLLKLTPEQWKEHVPHCQDSRLPDMRVAAAGFARRHGRGEHPSSFTLRQTFWASQDKGSQFSCKGLGRQCVVLHVRGATQCEGRWSASKKLHQGPRCVTHRRLRLGGLETSSFLMFRALLCQPKHWPLKQDNLQRTPCKEGQVAAASRHQRPKEVSKVLVLGLCY